MRNRRPDHWGARAPQAGRITPRPDHVVSRFRSPASRKSNEVVQDLSEHPPVLSSRIEARLLCIALGGFAGVVCGGVEGLVTGMIVGAAYGYHPSQGRVLSSAGLGGLVGLAGGGVFGVIAGPGGVIVGGGGGLVIGMTVGAAWNSRSPQEQRGSWAARRRLAGVFLGGVLCVLCVCTIALEALGSFLRGGSHSSELLVGFGILGAVLGELYSSPSWKEGARFWAPRGAMGGVVLGGMISLFVPGVLVLIPVTAGVGAVLGAVYGSFPMKEEVRFLGAIGGQMGAVFGVIIGALVVANRQRLTEATLAFLFLGCVTLGAILGAAMGSASGLETPERG